MTTEFNHTNRQDSLAVTEFLRAVIRDDFEEAANAKEKFSDDMISVCCAHAAVTSYLVNVMAGLKPIESRSAEVRDRYLIPTIGKIADTILTDLAEGLADGGNGGPIPAAFGGPDNAFG